jgi:hypothetical protein
MLKFFLSHSPNTQKLFPQVVVATFLSLLALCKALKIDYKIPILILLPREGSKPTENVNKNLE